MRFVETKIGRFVLDDDRDLIEEDEILSMLCSFALSPLNDGSLMVSMASIKNGARLTTHEANAICDRLVRRGYAERERRSTARVDMDAVRITRDGARFVASLRRPE